MGLGSSAVRDPAGKRVAPEEPRSPDQAAGDVSEMPAAFPVPRTRDWRLSKAGLVLQRNKDASFLTDSARLSGYRRLNGRTGFGSRQSVNSALVRQGGPRLRLRCSGWA